MKSRQSVMYLVSNLTKCSLAPSESVYVKLSYISISIIECDVCWVTNEL